MAMFGAVGTLGSLTASGARGIMHADSNLNLAAMANQSEDTGVLTSHVLHKSAAKALKSAANRQKQQDDSIVYCTRNGSEITKRAITSISMFQKRQPPGSIDVWWLYDDGGLTILLPYILSTRSSWSDCKLRIFALANRQQEMELEERNMANLLSKFRIDYSSLHMVQDITAEPKPESQQLFDSLLNGFRESEREDDDDECYVSDTEMATLHEKSNRQMRLRELLQEHSSEANLIIMSLPMPRKGTVSAPLYMAWLEVLTRDMPPFLLVRGNQTSVLTFYS
uniref:Putative solute carrier family 12 n=1 Tax=Xenopsylla cheopis TaxID=163159 RepID=A0A6M2DX53_XENCH